MARNRRRLLEAGKEVFATHGLNASLDEIARHAGMGVGTAHRHFKSRHEITGIIFSDVTNSFVEDADRSLSVIDPWSGFVSFAVSFAERQARDRGLHEILTSNQGAVPASRDWDQLRNSIAAVVDRAKRANVVRADLEVSDLLAFFATMGPSYAASIAIGTELWRRLLDAFLRGTRPDAAPAIMIPDTVSPVAFVSLARAH